VSETNAAVLETTAATSVGQPAAKDIGLPIVRFDNVSEIFCEKFDYRRKYAIWYMFSWGRKNIRNLKPGEIYALKNVSFTINKGDVFWITGTPGSGKSTIVKLISGALCADAGRVAVRGVVRSIGGKFRWNGFMTVRENVQFLGLLLGVPRQKLAAYVEDVLTFCGMSDIAEITAGNFSKKHFDPLSYVAMLFADADIYIFDGKAAMGDGELKTKITLWMQEKLKGKTLIVTSSGRPSFPFKWTPTRGVIMHEGEIIWQGPAEELLPAYDSWAAQRAEEQTKKPDVAREYEEDEDLDAEEGLGTVSR
jgi:ABC-type polysaccharide/polyol phosphate transport system ATPase subunit